MADERLQRAYRRRSDDLVETRAALAQAVDALTAQLGDRRREVATVMDQRDAAIREAVSTGAHVAELAARLEQADAQVTELAARLDQALTELAHVRGLRILRYTAWLRRLVYRLRTR
jgi:chromosome segregation ATPase